MCSIIWYVPGIHITSLLKEVHDIAAAPPFYAQLPRQYACTYNAEIGMTARVAPSLVFGLQDFGIKY